MSYDLNQYPKIWEDILSVIKENINEVGYKTWFKPAGIHEIDDEVNIIYLELANEDYRKAKVINDRYIEFLEHHIETALNKPYRVVVKVRGDYEREPDKRGSGKKKKKRPLETFDKQKIFDINYTFDNFVVAECNKYAHAACKAVSESPSQAYNPLFIYGGSGLGKTHLMHAIGIHLLENNDDINVLYVTSEMFTNDLIDAINKKETFAFKEKYRSVDVLLIDDIQFLENKDQTQVEFFNTFNELIAYNKQIVISSDRAPGNLSFLNDRIVSRLQSNIVVDLSPADYETRVAILQKEAAKKDKLVMDDDLEEVIRMIAERIPDNIRTLKGAFERLTSLAELMGEKIDKNLAKHVLKDIMENSNSSITPAKIMKTVCKYFNIRVSEMESSKRTNRVAYPRQIAMYLCRNMTDYSLPAIGNFFGGKHYTTVMHACDKIQKEISDDPNKRSIIESLEKEINEG